jgi:hypothetical protein
MPEPAKRRLENETVLPGHEAFECGDIARLGKAHERGRFLGIRIERRSRPACRFDGAVRYVHATQTTRDNQTIA